jgi:hypothetical protein
MNGLRLLLAQAREINQICMNAQTPPNVYRLGNVYFSRLLQSN